VDSQCGKLGTVVGHQFIILIVDPCTTLWAWGTASRRSVGRSGDFYL